MKVRRIGYRTVAALVVVAMLLGMAPMGALVASAATLTTVFINEIHYDNASTDAGEAIEIAGPAGTDLTGWSLVLYNGSGGASYNTTVLSGTIPDQQSGYGTVVVNYPVNGIQNGSPDGVALVNGTTAVQFLSYEGTFTAVGGPADGMTSTDIGVSEGSGTAVGDSLQLTGTGVTYEDFTWNGPIPNTFGAVNTGQLFLPTFINEIHYDNTGTDTGEAIEIAGPAGTDLTGWSLVLYNGSSSVLAPYDTIALGGTIPDQQSGYGTLSFDTPGIQNGSPDGVALVNGTTVVQFLSYEGTFTAADGPASGMTSTDIGVSEGSSTAVGDSLQLTGTGVSYQAFTWSGPIPNTFGAVNTGQTFSTEVNYPVVVNCASSLDAAYGFEASTAVTATDADGTVVGMDIEVSPVPAAGSIGLANFVAAAEVGGTASADVVVSDNVPVGTYTVTITATNDDAEPQAGECSLKVYVSEIIPIGTVQGSVSDTDDGATFASPYVGQYVTVQGVIFEKIVTRTSSGSSSYGFFMQNTAATADGDPNSSDGIFVYMGYYTDLIGGYVPVVGDEIVLRGRVSEYYDLTEISSASALALVRPDVVLDDELPPFEASPDSDLAVANRYWERREGMRGQVPAGSIVLNGRDVFASTLDGEVWVARSDTVIAGRTDPYERRAFRDPHPLDDIPDQLFDNGNGYRILMGSLGLKGAANDNTVLIAPARTFDTLTNAPIGGVYYSYGKYSIQIGEQITYEDGVDPALNAPPQELDRAVEYSIVTFNVENLYDYRNDPFDGCDFTGDSGCPGVNPPFDYVPASEDAYTIRVGEIAQQIFGDLHSPDIVMVQEAEDQDICTVVDEEVVCGETNNADGQPDTLQDVAVAIADLGGPVYYAAFDRDGADDRGIVSAFLYRADRAELLPADKDNPVLGNNPTVEYRSDPLPYNSDQQNPKALNAVLPDDVDTSTGVDGNNVFTRAPQVGLFRIWRDGIGASVFANVYAVSNHFSSGPDGRVGQRTEQANYNAAIVAALQAWDANVYVTVGGDLNVYPRPDDPFPPPNTSDQLAALYDQGMTNLWDVLVAETPASAYSYTYEGQAQTLDQMFVAPPLFGQLAAMAAAHINSDFPSDYVGDGPRGTSDHDPQVAAYNLVPTLDNLEALLQYYIDSGAIKKVAAKNLPNWIERARTFLENGQQAAYEAQLQAFIFQIFDYTPVFVTMPAANALATEISLLLSLS